jgi:hypothetical protein
MNGATLWAEFWKTDSGLLRFRTQTLRRAWLNSGKTTSQGKRIRFRLIDQIFSVFERDLFAPSAGEQTRF